MSSLCFVCQLPILSHQSWSVWIDRDVDEGEDDDDEDSALDASAEITVDPAEASTYHDDCLACFTCKQRLSGNRRGCKRFRNQIYCGLHYADVTGLSSGEEFMQKLREFKLHSLGCAEARRKSSTTLQFPVPIQSCPGSPSCEGFPHSIKTTPGYWVECSGSRTQQEINMRHGDPSLKDMELISFEDETYGKYFYGTEHWNYFTNDEALGPVLLSLKQENANSRDQFRVFLRTVSYNLHGLVPASCICANRYDREAVVRALANEALLKPLPVLGQLPTTPDELLKLDQVFIKSELKVGVVYVKEGQHTEEQILGNTVHSHLFDEFLMVLGDRIFLKGFDKYKGGLDTVHDLTGMESVYACWKGIEIMFHVSTLLPNEENDTQKLQRKRHIGNDIVCVVFLEADNTNFSPASIKSHFLHTFIVVKTSPTNQTRPTEYEVSVVTRDEVSAFKPYLWHRARFKKDHYFREWLMTKIVNGERASYSAPKFARMQDRTRSQMLEDIITNLQNYIETGQMPKPYRRGSWRPIGHMRPSSPLLDSVRDTFEGYEHLAKDFLRAFQASPHLCDIAFNVGQGKRKTKIYAVRAILGVRSRVFLEMLYGFTSTGLSQTTVPATEYVSKSGSNVRKSSNFLQVPDMHGHSARRQSQVAEIHHHDHSSRRASQAASSAAPMVFRAISRMTSWAGWGKQNRQHHANDMVPDNKDLRRWQSLPGLGLLSKKVRSRNSSTARSQLQLSLGNLEDLGRDLQDQPKMLEAGHLKTSSSWSGKTCKDGGSPPAVASASSLNCLATRDKTVRDRSQPQQDCQPLTLSVCANVAKIDRNKLCQTEFTIIEFDSETFQLIVEYLHSGCCPLSCETIPGLICAAEHFDLPELLQACFHHAKQYLHIEKVCGMLNVLENYYWRYTSASELVNTILQYSDHHARLLFEGTEFYSLSESMFQMVIGRELANVSELYKFKVMLRWTTKKLHMTADPEFKNLRCIMNRLSRDLKLYKIPPQDLIKVVLPSKTISNERILETLLYQADTGLYRIHASYLDQCQNSLGGATEPDDQIDNSSNYKMKFDVDR